MPTTDIPTSAIHDPVVQDALFHKIKRRWSTSEFRPLQREAIDAVLYGRDLVAVMPTGSGKSLCYQGPAAFRDGTTIVVSPLISLMKDQVDSLDQRGIASCFLNSTQHPREQSPMLLAILKGYYRLVYMAPERLLQPGTLASLVALNKAKLLNNIVIDEAHCVSMWGQDFRPEYAKLGQLREVLPGVPIQAFTATATKQIADDIRDSLRLSGCVELTGNFDRPDLILGVGPRVGNGFDQILNMLHLRPDGLTGGTIIYCRTRNDTERMAYELNVRGFAAQPYHAGLDDDVRERTQDRFKNRQLNTVVATIAFGMGIDRPDVCLIVHAAMPSSMENYHQEIGRAGRDGLGAMCVMLHGNHDFDRWLEVMDIETVPFPPPFPPHGVRPHEVQGHAHDTRISDKIKLVRLASVDDYARNNSTCRHRQLVEYFGQEYAPTRCGTCDVCEGEANL